MDLHPPEGWWRRCLLRSKSSCPCAGPSFPSQTWSRTGCIPVRNRNPRHSMFTYTTSCTHTSIFYKSRALPFLYIRKSERSLNTQTSDTPRCQGCSLQKCKNGASSKRSLYTGYDMKLWCEKVKFHSTHTVFGNFFSFPCLFQTDLVLWLSVGSWVIDGVV